MTASSLAGGLKKVATWHRVPGSTVRIDKVAIVFNSRNGSQTKKDLPQTQSASSEGPSAFSALLSSMF